MNRLFFDLWNPVFDGTPGTGVTNTQLDPLIPEHWANESLAVLIENMVMGNLVHRDFSKEFAQYGDVVNTRRPGTFTAKRKIDSEEVTTQLATSTNVPVKLNQHFHVSFYIHDGEDTVAFKDLVAEYLSPAVIAMAQGIDRLLIGQVVQFEANTAGKLGGMSSTNAKEYILQTRKVMNINKAYVTGRNLIVGPDTETTILLDDSFTSAEKVGDEGTALREASLGRKLGFNIFMSQNVPEFTNTDTGTADDIDNGNIAVGSTVITLTDSQYATIGDMITVAGDATPQRVTANNGTNEELTITPGLRNVIVDADAVVVYDVGLVDQDDSSDLTLGSDGSNSGYREGWHKDIDLNSLASSAGVAVGMGIVFGTATVASASDAKYTIIEVVSTSANAATIILDRPLDAAIVDNALTSMYPSGNYNLAFHKNAIAFVTRPLKTPRTGTGALSAVVTFDNLAIRACITYNGTKQAHLVTVDLLCGVKILDTKLGAVMYA